MARSYVQPYDVHMDDDDLDLQGPSDRSWTGWLVWVALIGAALLILWALGVDM